MAVKKKRAKANTRKTASKKAAPNSPFQTGLYAKLEAWMKKSPAKLIGRDEVAKHFKIPPKAASSALAYLYKNGRIYRHQEKSPTSTGFSYAVEIPEKDRATFGAGKSVSGFKGHSLQGQFVQIVNMLAKLEDAVVTMAVEHEEMKRKASAVDRLVAQYTKSLED